MHRVVNLLLEAEAAVDNNVDDEVIGGLQFFGKKFFCCFLDVLGQHIGHSIKTSWKFPVPLVLAVIFCIIENIGSGRNTNIHSNCLMFLSTKYGVYYII